MSLESKNQPTVLLSATVWWPLSARLALRLIGYGCRVIAICPRGHMLSHTSGIERVYPYHPLTSLASLEAAIRTGRPDLIVPCDDGAAWQIHELHARRSDLRPLIEASLGPATGYEIIASRDQLLAAAEALTIRVPETRRITSEDDVRGWFARSPSPAVLKLDGTWGGEGVEIARSQSEGLAAFRRLSRRLGLGTTFKRLFVNRDPLVLWAWRKQTPPVLTIQRFVAGRPANAMLACWRGELVSVVSVESLSTQGATGAAVVVRVVDNAEITRAARRLTERLNLTGFYGLDFMIEAETGFAHLIEMNPRCTQLGHLALRKQGDLAGALYAKLAGLSESPPPPDPIDNDVIAFFPQAIVWGSKSPFVRAGHLDVPWEDPKLMLELLREVWPNRQWSARLYHRFRPIRKVVATEMEPAGSTTGS